MRSASARARAVRPASDGGTEIEAEYIEVAAIRA